MSTNNIELMDSVIEIANANQYDKTLQREIKGVPNKQKFEVSLRGIFTDKQLLSSRLSKGITGAKIVELANFVNSGQEEGARASVPVAISADAIYTPFAGLRNGKQMDFVRTETYNNEVEVDGKTVTQVVECSWFTLSASVPRKTVSLQNFTF